jgi:uncharacterized protein YdeI (BOF family)
MRIRTLAVVLTVCIPAALVAQKGGRGGDNTSAPAPTGNSGPVAKSPTSGDLGDLNPAALLVDKKKKIPLADSTVAQLKAIQKKTSERNKQFFATYDSVRKWTMPLSQNGATQGFGLHGGVADAKIASTTVSPAEQAKMESSMHDLRLMFDEFRERRKADIADALAVVPEAQKKAAADLLAQQDADVEKLLGGRK